MGLEYVYRKSGGVGSMKHVAAAIYLSFGMLFLFLQGFEGFIGPENMNFIIFLFLMTGALYLYREIRVHFRKK